ncbi:MAG: signal peptide peptidase SppA [Prevotella sp.]|nr:signal peptide peptidase SppA [Prevotella sp.]
MKDFFKYVAATVVGLILFGIILTFFGILSIVGMITSGQATTNVSKNSVMVLKLDGIMEEQAGSNILGTLTGEQSSALGLQEILSAIKKAKTNENIKGIYIEGGVLASSPASLQEIRNALLDFKKSGKWIVAYADIYTQGTYYIASVADKVWMNPSGQLDWHGMGANPMYVKDLLKKFGVKVQTIKVGKYKSATEMFTEDKMSDANREQTTAYVTGIWQNICKGVSESRKISIDSLNAYADRLITFEDSKNFLKYKMVDALLYTDQVKAEVKKLLELKEDESINQVDVEAMTNVKEETKGEEIAVYYAYGDIVDSPSPQSMLSESHQIVAKDVCADLEKLMNNEDVKAVVIRVNSPGGSAYASEQLWRQIDLLKQKKPVVISMGDYAASGGYYMSCNANWIVAEPTTITGSIGIFGMIPDASELITQKLGVKFDEVKTNRNTTLGTFSRPMNAEEIGYISNYVERGYNLFRKRVADGRKMTIQQVEEVAQGHVFLGQDALKIKLVDELGGLDKAVAKAAQLAKVNEYYTASYPASPDIIEQLLSATKGGTYLDDQARLALGEFYEPVMLLKSVNRMDMVQARLPFFLNIK